MKDIGVYVHIPFCKSKCLYCDFNSYTNKQDLVEKYIYYLKKEIDLYTAELKEFNVKTIFIGGGTPSYVDGRYIYEIIEHMNKRLNMSKLAEFSIEVNPKTLDREKLNIYKQIGINRISMGVQSFNNDMLKRIGRIHSANDVIETYNMIRKHGFDNINFDIMFNLPEQSIDNVKDTLKKAIILSADHISYYSLKLEEGTPFYISHQKSELQLPDEDEEREMYHSGVELLKQNGYYHYEISNFAKKEYKCEHNLIYWNVEPYVGLGISAHSNINNKRYGNLYDFEDYFTKIDNKELPITEVEVINREMEMAEYIILGLRLIQGINKSRFARRFSVDIGEKFGDIITKHVKQGLLYEDLNNIKLTKQGLDLCNLVFMDILP
ncbi:radical SAM family heme chaperone HemW [Brassicibacter mesophilus]|uniref:radical SAM family heme chaperone HemW n=1 Tax=Brassicibacter mesophilus TaxID=745119 RepID=UPI003D1D4EA8